MVGLGNPGVRYAKSRHNVGFLAVDAIAEAFSVRMRKPFRRRYEVGQCVRHARELFLAKPLTFMNRSGEVVLDLIARSRSAPGSMLVIYDNMDLYPGNCRLKLKGSSGGHNGLESLGRRLGTTAFMRLAVGIGRPAPGMGSVEYVLGEPSVRERELVRAAIDRMPQIISTLLSEGPQRLMNELNRRQREPESSR